MGLSFDLSISEELWQTYIQVRLELTLSSGHKCTLFDPSAGLEICTELKEYLYSGPGFIITAWNPLSQVVSERENCAANLRLEGRLVSEASALLPAVGSSPDESYREEGFAVFGVEAPTLFRAALAFRQHAVYAFDATSLICITSDLSEHRSLSSSSKELVALLHWDRATREAQRRWSS